MPASWNSTLSTGRSEPLSLPGLAWPIELRPHPRARAMRLRLDEARERLTLTYPRRMSRRAALEWAQRQADWVEVQLTGLQPGEPFHPGSTIPVEGQAVQLHWDESLPADTAPCRWHPELWRAGGGLCGADRTLSSYPGPNPAERGNRGCCGARRGQHPFGGSWRRLEPLGQLLGKRCDPVQLAVDPCPAAPAALGRGA